jgi:hypothetical protein
MKKIIYRFVIILFLILISSIVYLSVLGIETKKFNNQISNELKNINPKVKIHLKKIILKLDPINFQLNITTIGPRIVSDNDIIEIESIKTNIFLNSIFKEKLLIKNLQISTKTIELKKFISFIRNFNKSTELLILQNFIKNGFLIANLNIEFDENGNIKKNIEASGIIKSGKVKLLGKNKLEKINFSFNIKEQITQLEKINLTYNELDLSFKKLIIKNENNEFHINGEINNKNFLINKENIDKLLNKNYLNIKKINLSSNNIFSFKVTKKFKLKDFKLNSEIKLNELLLNSNFKLKSFFPKFKQEITFKDHKLNLIYNKNKINIKGEGDIFLQESTDKIIYSIDQNNKDFNFNTTFEINDNPFLLSFLNYEKSKNNKAKIIIDGTKFQNNTINIKSASLIEGNNNIEVKNLILAKDYKILKFKSIKFDYLDKEKYKNFFKIIDKDKNYIFEAKNLNFNKILDDLINPSSDEIKLNLFQKKTYFDVQIDNMQLDKINEISNFNGNLVFENNEIIDANLSGFFLDSKKIKFTVKSQNYEKITTLFTDKAKPLVKRYKFIKGFEDGSLDFYSIKKGNKSDSTLRIYDFRLKELPGLTKLLTLASLQGIADLLTGEGIRFNEFEMNFNNKGSLMNINELYAIGPAIYILMDGYIEKDKLISLKGTLVPATTINKVISSIPFLGQILVGSKTGEGVFGVSFKMKGPPKKIETTVNPIKTLTPRFITRTLENIKKTN